MLLGKIYLLLKVFQTKIYCSRNGYPLLIEGQIGRGHVLL